jgi:F-type H+-transporting ATPase subunit delta
MKEARVAHRYAHALFSVALSREILDIVASELFQLKSFIDKDRRFVDFLEAPQVTTENKNDLLKTLFAGRISAPLFSFLLLLVEKSRIEFLGEIAEEFEKLLEDHRGIIKAVITTAIPLDEAYKQGLRTKLERLSGKKIDIVHRIDKNIIGGIIVQLNYQVIDRSIRHELNSLRHDLLALKVH